jgi:hypothetical protein
MSCWSSVSMVESIRSSELSKWQSRLPICQIIDRIEASLPIPFAVEAENNLQTDNGDIS